jgi:hypothetical protein
MRSRALNVWARMSRQRISSGCVDDVERSAGNSRKTVNSQWVPLDLQDSLPQLAHQPCLQRRMYPTRSMNPRGFAYVSLLQICGHTDLPALKALGRIAGAILPAQTRLTSNSLRPRNRPSRSFYRRATYFENDSICPSVRGTSLANSRLAVL